MRYFELTFDDCEMDGWELSFDYILPDGSWRDVWAFTRCDRLHLIDPICLKVVEKGPQLDFNIADFNIPVASQKLGDILAKYCKDDIQRIPVELDDPGKWEILNVLSCVDCLDHLRSRIDYYPSEPNDPSVLDNPDKAGKPRGIRSLQIDASAIDGQSIFRIKDWLGPIIVAENVKDAIEHSNCSGIKMIAVG